MSVQRSWILVITHTLSTPRPFQEHMAEGSERTPKLSALSANNYKHDKLLQAAGVSIQGNFTQIQGMQLTAPKLKVGNGEDLVPRFGRWNFRGKKMVEPAKIQKWAIVNFSIQKCDVQKLSNDFCRMAHQMGMLGGLNSLLAVERPCSIPLISKIPTIILGMDVSHGSPGQSDVPSVAALVISRQWPLISRYRASVRTQSPKVEMIDTLYKRVSDTVDEGLVR
ncbi:hypothetical protein ACHQM5_000932 [Ranunculus cassubicifolius]